MALFVKQNEKRSELQERLAAELREKAKARANAASDAPDGVTDSQFIRGTKQTTSLAWIWVTIAVFAVVAFVIIVWP